MKPKFKIGDQVWVNTRSKYFQERLGEISKILLKGGGCCAYEVILGDGWVGLYEEDQLLLGSGRNMPAETTSAIAEVVAEMNRQRELWGEQNHNPHIYMSILLEEVGEAAQALNEFYFKKEPKELEHFREELVQSAAVAISIVECIDRDKWVMSK